MRNAEAVDDMPGTHDADGQAARLDRAPRRVPLPWRDPRPAGACTKRAAALVDLLCPGSAPPLPRPASDDMPRRAALSRRRLRAAPPASPAGHRGSRHGSARVDVERPHRDGVLPCEAENAHVELRVEPPALAPAASVEKLCLAEFAGDPIVEDRLDLARNISRPICRSGRSANKAFRVPSCQS